MFVILTPSLIQTLAMGCNNFPNFYNITQTVAQKQNSSDIQSKTSLVAMPDDNRTAPHKQNSSKNLEEEPKLKLSTESQIMIGKAQNKEKKENRRNLFHL